MLVISTSPDGSNLRCVVSHAPRVQVVCLAVMGSQLVALGAASWLHSLQQAAYEQWLDDREEAEARAREVLEQAAERQYAGGRGGCV